MDGLPWTWNSCGEYLDAVQGLEPTLNIVGLAGHSPIRFLGHTVPGGRCTPGTWADLRETETIQQAIIEGGGAGGLFQAAPGFSTRFGIELEMFEKGAELGCHVMFSDGARPKGDGDVSFWEDFIGRNKAEGRRITTIAHTRPSEALFRLAQICPFRSAAWKELMGLPTIADRYERLNDPVARKVLITEAKEVGFLWNSAPKLHPLSTGEFPDYDLEGKASLTQLAEASGQDPVDVFVDHMFESEGRELFNM